MSASIFLLKRPLGSTAQLKASITKRWKRVGFKLKKWGIRSGDFNDARSSNIRSTLTRLMSSNNVSMSKKVSHCPFFRGIQRIFGIKNLFQFFSFFYLSGRLVKLRTKEGFICCNKIVLLIKNVDFCRNMTTVATGLIFFARLYQCWLVTKTDMTHWSRKCPELKT